MTSYNFDEINEYIENSILIENAIVTFKSLTLEFQLPLSLSKIILNEFVQTKIKEKFNIWYYIVGEVESSPNHSDIGEDIINEIKIQLAFGQNELDELVKTYIHIQNIFVYAIGPYTSEKSSNHLDTLVMSNTEYFNKADTTDILNLGGLYRPGIPLDQLNRAEPKQPETSPIIPASKPLPLKTEAKPINTKPIEPVKQNSQKTSKSKTQEPATKKAKTITETLKKKEPAPSSKIDNLFKNSKSHSASSQEDSSDSDSSDELFQTRRKRPVVFSSDHESDNDSKELPNSIDNHIKKQIQTQPSNIKSQKPQPVKNNKRPLLQDSDDEFEFFEESSKSKSTKTKPEEKEEPPMSKQEETSKPKSTPSNDAPPSKVKKPNNQAKSNAKNGVQSSLLNFFQKK